MNTTIYTLTTIFLCDNEIDHTTTVYTNKEDAQKTARKELQMFKDTYITPKELDSDYYVELVTENTFNASCDIENLSIINEIKQQQIEIK